MKHFWLGCHTMKILQKQERTSEIWTDWPFYATC